MTVFSRPPVLAVVLGCAGAFWALSLGPAWAKEAGHGTGMGMTDMSAASPDFDRKSALETSQAAIGRQVGEYQFTDINGDTVRLSDLAGSPVFVSLIYTSCAHTCPLLTQTLSDAAGKAWDAVGEGHFNLITIGFDVSEDTPLRMRSFALKQGINDPRWKFLSADQETINKLSKELGFLYFASPRGFDHLAQTTLLDDKGRIAAQIYGQDISAPQLVEPLKHLSFGGAAYPTTVTNWIDNVRLFCTIYDPSSGRYRFDYSIILGTILGVLCLSAVFAFLIHILRHGRPPSAKA